MNRFSGACLLPLLMVSACGHAIPQGKSSAAPVPSDAAVAGLYKQVVAHPPLGVPDTKIFGPYLSKELLHKLDETGTCARDYYRQNPDPNMKPPSFFIEDGYFSGANEEAEPQTFHVEKSESGKDGSSRVYVKLTHEEATFKLIWHVVAVVVRENDRPVVDDVIFLKDKDHPVENRLSEDFARDGCRGPRWGG